MFRPAPRVYATVRRDGSGEISFNGVSTVVKGESLQEAGSLAVAMVAQKAAQWGKPLRMTAQSPIDTRVLMVHPDGHLTDAKDRWWRPGSLLAGGVVTVALGLAIWFWLGPAVAGNDQASDRYTTVAPVVAEADGEFGPILPTAAGSIMPSPTFSPEPAPVATVAVPVTPEVNTATTVPGAEPLVGVTGSAPTDPVTIKATTARPAKKPKPSPRNQVVDRVGNEPTWQSVHKSSPRPVQPQRTGVAVIEVG